MFSMKYTSPKVTPKKGGSPPPLPSASSSVCAVALSSTAAASSMPEHDPAVADILSEEVEELPSRTNFLALLDREYAARGNASGYPGEGARNKHADDEYIARGCGMTDDETNENNGVECAPMIDNLSSPISLQQAYSTHESPKGSFEYRRSISTEIMVGCVNSPVEETAVKLTKPIYGGRSSGNEGDAQSVPQDRDEQRSSRSPTICDISESQSSSPIMSEVNTDRKRSYDEPILQFTSDAATKSDYHVGGDTYFEEKTRTADSRVDVQFAHVTLPSKVNRTDTTGHANKGTSSASFMPDYPLSPPQLQSLGTTPFFPNRTAALYPMSPRQPFSHTHSLLDDCSDDEEEEGEVPSYHIVLDSPNCHSSSYSHLSTSHARLKKQQGQVYRHPSGTSCSATQVATKNIHHALLQTRHRRWSCQSAYAGMHHQSSQVFDLSNRFYYLGHLGALKNYERNGASRLSVSAEAVRAAALASGLWRTVRLVRLPRGLFWSPISEMEEKGLSGARKTEVWALLNMLDSTFVEMDQLCFGGDFARLFTIAQNSNDYWRILSYITKCLPRVVAIDGIVMERDSQNPNSEFACQNDASNLEKQCSDEAKNAAKCGFSDLVGSEAERSQSLDHSTLSAPTSDDRGLHFHAEVIVGATRPGQCDDGGSVAFGNILEKVRKSNEDSSMLSSSRSWGSNGSGNRPPACPMSSRHRSLRLPSKPVTRKKKKNGTFMENGGLKRRVLGLLPAVSMMDDDADSDDSEETCENDCPADLL